MTMLDPAWLLDARAREHFKNIFRERSPGTGSASMPKSCKPVEAIHNSLDPQLIEDAIAEEQRNR
jgi:hypothetical protein